jgi:hypothetical protein
MEPGTHRDIHELLTSYGYWKSEVCKSRGADAKYYRYSKADRGNRHTVHAVYIHHTGSWEHSVLPMDEDKGWAPGGSGQGVDYLKAYLQKEYGDVLKGFEDVG